MTPACVFRAAGVALVAASLGSALSRPCCPGLARAVPAMLELEHWRGYATIAGAALILWSSKR